MCFSETWLSQSITDSILGLKNFKIFRKDRATRGGGCLIAVSNSLFTRECDIEDIHSEIISVSITLNNVSCLVVCCYCPPNLSSLDLKCFYSDLTLFVKKSRNCVIVGDFNIPTVNTRVIDPTLKGANEFIDFLLQNQPLRIINNETTRGPHVLDLVLTNCYDIIQDCETLPSLFGSDHNLLKLSFLFTPLKSKALSQKDFLKGNYSNISCYFLYNIKPIKIANESCQRLWEIFRHHLSVILDKQIPIRKFYLNRPIKSNKHIY